MDASGVAVSVLFPLKSSKNCKGVDEFIFTYFLWSHSYGSNKLTYFPSSPESLRYLSMYDNRCLRYFKGHSER